MNSESWAKRYAPTKLSDVIGQTKATRQFIEFIRNFPKSKAVLFAGLPGVGKTSLIYAFAKEYNYEVVEMNASDKRNKDVINSIILPACQQASIFGGKKIIVLDEIDGLSGMKDRGGATELAKVIDETKFPLILIANDAYSSKLKSIRKKATLIGFDRINYLSIAKHLCGICAKENIEYDELAIRELAQASQGDLRAAINDLQVLATEGRITQNKLAQMQRNQEESIFEVLKAIFKSNSSDAVFDAVDNLSEDYGILSYWLDENMHKEYRGLALSRGYDCVSRADILSRRIMKQQHWRFLAYIRELVSVGVQSAKKGRFASNNWVSYRPPSLMLKMWHRNARRKKMLAEMEKAGEKLHASVYRLEQDFLPYFEFIGSKNKTAGKEIKEWLG